MGALSLSISNWWCFDRSQTYTTYTNLGHYKLHSWFPSYLKFTINAGGRDGNDVTVTLFSGTTGTCMVAW